VNVIDPKQVKQVKEFKHGAGLMACRYDDAGKYVFASARDFAVVRWEVGTGKATLLTAHQSWVRGLAWLAPAKQLVSGDYHGKLIWWDALAEKPAAIRTIDAHDGWVRMVAASPDGKTLASCGNDHLIKLWDAATGKPLATLNGHDCHVYYVIFHPDGKSLLSGDHKSVLKQWDLAKGTVTREFKVEGLSRYDTQFKADIGGPRSMAFDREGKTLAVGGITDVTNAFAGIGKPIVLLYDWASGKRTQALRPAADVQATAWGVAIHPSGLVLGAGSGRAGEVWFWKPDQPASIHTLTKQPNARDLALAPGGGQFAVPFVEGMLRVYELGAAKSA
jgi:WD40 repeat protein